MGNSASSKKTDEAKKTDEEAGDGQTTRSIKSSNKKNKVAVDPNPENVVPPCFTVQDAKYLKEYFHRLETAKKKSDHIDKRITVDDITKLPELSLNPFVSRVVDVVCSEMAPIDGLDLDQVDFMRFIRILGVFHSATPTAEKQVYSFKVFDFDGDGVISRDDMLHSLSYIHPGLPKSELDYKVDLIFESVDREKDISIDPDDFFKLFDQNGFARFFTIFF